MIILTLFPLLDQSSQLFASYYDSAITIGNSHEEMKLINTNLT